MSFVQRFLEIILPECPRLKEPPGRPTKTRPDKIDIKVPDNVRTLAGQNYEMSVEVVDEIKTYVAERYEGQGRISSVTSFDLIEIENSTTPKLKEEKYKILKSYWAKDRSATTTAGMINKRGFRKRTIDTYFSAMQRALENEYKPPPPVT